MALKKSTTAEKVEKLASGAVLELETIEEIKSAYNLITGALTSLKSESEEVVQFITKQAKENMDLQLASLKRQHEIAVTELKENFEREKRKVSDELSELKTELAKQQYIPIEFEKLQTNLKELQAINASLNAQIGQINQENATTKLIHTHELEKKDAEVRSEKQTVAILSNKYTALEKQLTEVNKTIGDFLTGRVEANKYAEAFAKLEGMLSNTKR